MVGFRANSLPDVIYGNLILARMVWIAKSYFGHASEELLIEEFLGDLCFQVTYGRFYGKFSTRCQIWGPNLVIFYE